MGYAWLDKYCRFYFIFVKSWVVAWVMVSRPAGRAGVRWDGRTDQWPLRVLQKDIPTVGFHRGDRVRLTACAAARQTQGYRHCPRRHIEGKRWVDWPNRCGTVTSTPIPGSSGVCIKWDGCRSTDSWPKGMVERVELVSA